MRPLMLLVLATSLLSAENWPQWRGPDSNGISKDPNVATEWSATQNVAWKTPIDGWGTSTPIVWNGRVFLTSQLGDGPVSGRDFPGAAEAKRLDPSRGVEFLVLALDLATGKQVWARTLVAEGHLPSVHVKHNLASPSCVTDGERVYAWFGTGLVIAFDFDGAELWRRHLGKERTAFDVKWGHGSSPTLYEDKLYLLVDHPDDSYLVAVNKETGKDLWVSERGDGARSYTTPKVVPTKDGDRLIVNTNAGIQALDPATGDVKWTEGAEIRVPVGTPVFHDGILYSNRGYNSSPYLAVSVNEPSERVQWRTGTGGPYVSSVLYYEGLIFMATERGIASAIDAENGELLWRERIGGVFSASPLAAGGNVYFTNEDGKTFVVEAAREFKLVAENDLKERSLASLAVSNGKLLVRTDDHLYAISNDE